MQLFETISMFSNFAAQIKFWEPVIAFVSMLAAILASISAWMSFRQARNIRTELKSDEILIAGELHNPSLSNPDHENSVIQTTVFNKSKRKAYISKLRVYDSEGREIEVTWSDIIDQYGNPQGNAKIIGVVDTSPICIRRNDGLAMREVRVEVTHSFDTKPMLLTYQIDPGWQAYFAK